MMKLSIMREYLESNNHQLFIEEVLAKWGYDKGTVRFFRGSSNFVYLFERDRKKFVLRITPEADEKRLKNESTYLDFLREQGLQVNKVIFSNDGNKMEKFISPIGEVIAMVFEYFEGMIYEVEDLTDHQFYLWGKKLGELHASSKQFNQQISLSLLQEHANLLKNIPKEESLALKEWKIIKEWMKTLPNDNVGVLHFDFELDNLIWKQEEIQIIDFESHRYGPFVADVAFALRDLFDEKVDLANAKLQLFLKGYLQKSRLASQEVEMIPMFLRYHNLLTFVKLLQTIDVEDSDTNPDWVNGLRRKLIGKCEGYRGGFGKVKS